MRVRVGWGNVSVVEVELLIVVGNGSVAIRGGTTTCDDVVVSCVGHSSASVAVVMEYTEASVVGCFRMKVR
jgi:hypothetical protein